MSLDTYESLSNASTSILFFNAQHTPTSAVNVVDGKLIAPAGDEVFILP